MQVGSWLWAMHVSYIVSDTWSLPSLSSSASTKTRLLKMRTDLYM